MEGGREKNRNLIVVSKDEWLRVSIGDILETDGLVCIEETAQLSGFARNGAWVILADALEYGRLRNAEFKAVLERFPNSHLVLILDGEGIRYARLPNSPRLHRTVKENMDRELPLLLDLISSDQAGDVRREQEETTNQERKDVLVKQEQAGLLNRPLTRRSFLKGTAAAAAAAGVAMSGGMKLLSPVAEAAPGDADNVERIYQGVCRGNCSGACGMNVHVRGGKVVKTSKLDSPDPLETRICPKGLSHVQHIYSSERLKYPLKRVGARGAGEWERITWDDAIREITDKWKQIIAEDGPSSVGHMFGSGTYANNWMYHRRIMGNLGATEIVPPYDTAGLQMMAIMCARGPLLHGNVKGDVLNSKYIFTWGSSVPTSGPAKWTYNLAAMDNGAKSVVINPNYTLAARHADTFVPIRPGTDGILAMAMTNIVIKEGLQDDEFMRKGTTAPYLVKQSDGKFLRKSDLGPLAEGEADGIVLRGTDGTVGPIAEIAEPVLNGSFTINGHKVDTGYKLLTERVAEWTPERAAQMCDIPVDTIYKIARMFAEGPTHVDFGFGIDHWVRGAAPYQCIAVLAFVTGQFGRPGTGFGGKLGGDGTGMMLNWMSLFTQPGHTPAAFGIASNNIPALMKTGKYGDRDLKLRSVLSYAGNPLSAHPGRKQMIEWFNSMEMVVAADIVMTDTCRYADYVLPVPHWFEVETFVSMSSEFLRMNEAAQAPLYESKSDIDIGNLIAKAMGLDDLMMTNDEFHADSLNTAAAKEFDLSWEALKEKKIMRGVKEGLIYGENYAPLRTESGRCTLYLENPTPNYLAGPNFDKRRMALPHWDPPVEAWYENPLIQKYPLNLMSHRHRFKTHITFSKGMPWLLELMPEPLIGINPVDAAARGVKDGDYVRLYNDRGHVVMKAQLNPGLRPGIVDAEHTWEESQYVDGHYHDLMEIYTDEWITAGTFYDTLCQVEKVELAEVERLKAAKNEANQAEQAKLSKVEGVI